MENENLKVNKNDIKWFSYQYSTEIMNIDIVLDALDTNINSNITNYIKFLDTKQNMIMDGDFTKIIYSDEMVTMNGLYFTCPLILKTNDQYTKILQNPLRNHDDGSKRNEKLTNIDNTDTLKQNKIYSMENKNVIWFYPYHSQNENIISLFSELEKTILDEYIRHVYGIKLLSPPGFINTNKSIKTPIYSLHNQLLSGNVKYYSKNGLLTSRGSSNNLSTDADKSYRLNFKKVYIIKISGIWETSDHVGITYKLLETTK